jgi:glycosyltransferase involved in cell wall biosynthesis
MCELLIRRLVGRIVHALIAHTKAAKDDIVETLRVKDHEKIFVIPHGNYIGCYKNEIDGVEARRQLGIADSKIVMLFFGVIDPYKGTEELIEAFKALEPEGVHLLVVGRCSEDELAQSITGRIQGRGNITFVGEFVADDKIQVFMNASDVVVLPYRTMLTSGAAILATSFGKACVAPGLGFFREVLDNTGTIFYQPNSDGGLLGALRTAVERSSDLREMGEHNKKRSGRWDWHTVAAMTVDVYRRVCGQGGELPAAIDQTNAMDSLAAEPVVEESPL